MSRLPCLLTAVFALASPMALGADEAQTSPQKKEAAFDRKEYEENEKALRQLLDGTLELAQGLATELKEGKKNDQQSLQRLEEQNREIERLKAEQLEMIRKLKVTDPGIMPFDEMSDLYFRGWLLSRDAGKLKDQGKIANSRKKLEEALILFDAIAAQHPAWKPEMVQGRLKKTKEELSSLPPEDR